MDKFVDYGAEKGTMSEGLAELYKETTSLKAIQQCGGKRQIFILFGGSGAGKTFTTEALMRAFSKDFKNYYVDIGVTETIADVTNIYNVDLLKEAFLLNGEKKSCVTQTKKKTGCEYLVNGVHAGACQKKYDTHQNCYCGGLWPGPNWEK